jgi:hypothetical protein
MTYTITYYITLPGITYHSRFIPEEVVEASQIFLRDAHVLGSYEEYAGVTGDKTISVLSQSISGVSAIIP